MSVKLRYTANVLASGGIIAYPTEAVWGLGCDPNNPEAVLRLLRMKQRDWRKGLILVAASTQQLEPYLATLTDPQWQKLKRSWPGPVTWIVPHSGNLGSAVYGQHSTVAVRVSAHPVVRNLCTYFGGPIISTSANPAGLKPARDRLTVRRYFGESIDAYAPGALGGALRPSEIRDLLSGKIIRQG